MFLLSLLYIPLITIFWKISIVAVNKCDCKRDRPWVRFPLEEIKYLILLFYSLWYGGKARRQVPPLITQFLQNSAENGGLILSYYMRDTAWSWKKMYYFIKWVGLDFNSANRKRYDIRVWSSSIKCMASSLIVFLYIACKYTR